MRKDDERVDQQLAGVAARVKARLEQRSMTQAELADAIQLSHPTMSHYMTGKRAIPVPTLITIAEVLKMKPSQLL